MSPRKDGDVWQPMLGSQRTGLLEASNRMRFEAEGEPEGAIVGGGSVSRVRC